MIRKVIQKGEAGLSLLNKRNFNQWLVGYEYRKRKTHLISFPHTFDIENTVFCNLHCIMCPYDEITREKGNMDFELLKKVIYDIKDCANSAWLSGMIGQQLGHHRPCLENPFICSVK